MNASGSPVPDSWLAELDWTRRLARALVRDEHLAEDLAQDAMISAITHPPHQDVPVRRSIAKRVRNLAISFKRSKASRSTRERAVSRADTWHDITEETEEQYAQARLLQDLASELDEPYRSVIRLQYYDGLKPAEIAARAGRPVETIKSHRKRALERLKTELDRRNDGDRKAWMAALTALADDQRPRWISLGSKPFVLWSAGMLLVLGIIALLGLSDPQDATLSLAGGRSDNRARGDATPEGLDPLGPGSRREALSSPDSATAPVGRVHGRIVDPARRPVSGLGVIDDITDAPLLLDGELVQSGIDGSFIVDVPTAASILVAENDQWMLVFGDIATSGAELTIVVAERRTIAGIVADAHGSPLAGVKVHPWQVYPLLTLAPSERSVFFLNRDFEATTGSDGRYEIRDVPWIQGLTLQIQHPAYSWIDIPLDQVSDWSSMTVSMRRDADEFVVVKGLVEDPATGLPVAHCMIRSDPGDVDRTSKADDAGRFEIALDTSVFCKRVGGSIVWPPAETDSVRIVAEAESRWGEVKISYSDVSESAVDDVRIALERPAAQVTGQVVEPPGLLAKAKWTALLHSGEDFFYECVDGFADATGVFVFNDIPNGSYDLTLHADDGRFVHKALEVSGDSTVRIEASSRSLYSYSGRILDRAGQPVSTFTVHFSGTHHPNVPSFYQYKTFNTPTGSFCLESPVRLTSLSISSDGYDDARIAREGLEPDCSMAITLTQLRSILFSQPSKDADITAFGILDEQGHWLEVLWEFRSGDRDDDLSDVSIATLKDLEMWSSAGTVEVHEHVYANGEIMRVRLPVSPASRLLVSERATTLVLFRGDQVGSRIPITLTDGVNVLPPREAKSALDHR